MSRVSWRNGLLLAVVAALGAYAFLRSGRNAPIEYPLTRLKPQEVKSVRVERPGAAQLLLERQPDGWHIAAPFEARADVLRVQQILAIAEAKSLHRLPATDLTPFELDRPVARVTLADQTFSFGMVNPITREQYVLSGEIVYTLHPRYGAALPANPAEAASRQLLAADETPVRIELREFTVEQRNGRWAVMPSAGAISQDDLLRWVEEWRLTSALRVEPRGKAKALSEIRMRLKNGENFTLAVLARQPELVLARSDEKLQYHLRPEAAKRLLSPPAAAREERTQKK